MSTAITALVTEADSEQPEAGRLAAEITGLCSHIYAAEYRLLTLIREFDTKAYWAGPGLCSCAHWLNFRCGIGMAAAREKVRVAHALAVLPKISAAFERGVLSYSKVRALTRIADADNEDYLLMLAGHGTAHHVEKLVARFRKAQRLEEAELAEAQYRQRELSHYYDHDGCLVLRARLPAEIGALVVKALEMALDRRGDEAGDVTAQTSAAEREPIAARRADALAGMAEAYLNGGEPAGSTAERYQVVVHVTAETSHLADGPGVTAETSRRLACDSSVVRIREDRDGEPLSIGRRSRAIPPPMRRALTARDRGCRFPGCTHTRFVDGHHVEHWADGGETSLDNLVLLCRHHHHLVHEGGFVCEKDGSGEIVFRDRQNDRLATAATLPGVSAGVSNVEALRRWLDSEVFEAGIETDACVAKWHAGDRMDWQMAVSALFPR